METGRSPALRAQLLSDHRQAIRKAAIHLDDDLSVANCRKEYRSGRLASSMQRRCTHRTKFATTLSWKQRIVAWLLFVVAVFLVIDPLWECHDHLDNLRHLGPHGMLVILLLAACASISLLKTFQWLGLVLVATIAGRLRPWVALRALSRTTPLPAFAPTPPPLRV
jgi:hypothetical protein